MNKRATTRRGASWRHGATSGALALAVLALGTPALVQPSSRADSAWPLMAGAVQAEELNCIDDKDNFDAPECVEQRAAGKREADKAQAAQQGQESQPTQEGQPAQQGPSAQQSSPPPATEEQAAPAPGPTNNPNDIVLKLADAGKEATPYIEEEGSDKYGRWVRKRFERDRGTSASSLGPNVLDSKGWVTKDVETAKALFKEQAAIKTFPERKEALTGPNEKAKPPKFAEEFSVVTQYFQDDKVWHHYRIVMRNGANVAVLYMFGREDFFTDRKDKTWNGTGDWYIKTLAERL